MSLAHHSLYFVSSFQMILAILMHLHHRIWWLSKSHHSSLTLLWAPDADSPMPHIATGILAGIPDSICSNQTFQLPYHIIITQGTSLGAVSFTRHIPSPTLPNWFYLEFLRSFPSFPSLYIYPSLGLIITCLRSCDNPLIAVSDTVTLSNKTALSHLCF